MDARPYTLNGKSWACAEPEGDVVNSPSKYNVQKQSLSVDENREDLEGAQKTMWPVLDTSGLVSIHFRKQSGKHRPTPSGPCRSTRACGRR